MKYSTFNSWLSIDNCHTLLFNSLSGKFVVVKNQILDFSRIAVSSIKDDTPQLYQQLCEAGAIIDDSIDEVDQLNKEIYRGENNSDEFILHINPTLDCNFNCWYCYENHIPHSKMKEGISNSVKMFITSKLKEERIRRLLLGFFGGEPLFYFNSIAKEIISHAGGLCKKYGKELYVSFTSNGSLLTDEIVGFLAEYDCSFQITFDGGRESHDTTRYYKNKRGSYDDIVSNIHKLVNAGISVIARVNYTSSNIDSVAPILTSFNVIPSELKKYIRFDFQRVWQDRLDRNDDTEIKIRDIRNTFREAGFCVLTNYLPHNVSMSCYGDKLNHALINYNGDVFGCTARDFTPDNRIGIIDSEGVVHYDTEIVSTRNNSKLSKPICQTCRIAPICGGGCKQRAYELRHTDGCNFGYSDADKDNIILDIFEYSFVKDLNQ